MLTSVTSFPSPFFKGRIYFTLFSPFPLIFILFTSVYAAPPLCTSKPVIINLVNRPSVADSPCTIPYKQAEVEMGYAYSVLPGGGYGHDYPESVLRLGLTRDTEVVTIFPNQNVQSIIPRRGSSAAVVGLKHQVAYTDAWLGTIEALITLPSGSANFGSPHYGATVNGIFIYGLMQGLSATLMVGVSSQTFPSAQGGERYQSFNPDGLLTYQWNQFAVYGEIAGQTNAGPGLGSGYNADVGLLYAIHNNMEIDAVIGKRLSGQWGGFERYYGAGFSILFG